VLSVARCAGIAAEINQAVPVRSLSATGTMEWFRSPFPVMTR